jgi:regulator of replication initiation timing
LEAEKLKQTDIKKENTNLLSEIKTLSVENASLRGSKEKSTTQINQLFDQITELKQKVKSLQKDNEELMMKSPAPQSANTEHKSIIPTNIKITRTNPNIDFQKDHLENSLFTERLEEYYIAVNTLLSESRFEHY